MASSTDPSFNINQAFKDYRWYNSYNVPLEVQCRLCRMEVPSDMSINTDTDYFQDIHIDAQLISNQMLLHECTVSSRFGHNDDTKNIISWEDVLLFPVKYKDLSQDAIIAFTAYNGNNEIIGGTTLRLFHTDYSLKYGKQKLLFYFNDIADTNVIIHENDTPGDLYDVIAPWDQLFQIEKRLEKFRHAHLSLSTIMNDVYAQNNTNTNTGKKKLEWLDKLTYERLESIIQYHYSNNMSYNNTNNSSNNNMNMSDNLDSSVLSSSLPPPMPSYNNTTNTTNTATTNITTMTSHIWGKSPEEYDIGHLCFLIIELPIFQYPILFEEKPYNIIPSIHIPLLHIDDIAHGCIIRDHMASEYTTLPPNMMMTSGGSSNSGIPLSVNSTSGSSGGGTGSILEFSVIGRNFDPRSLCVVADWDIGLENLSELQYRSIAHDSIRGNSDPKLKPNLYDKEKLDKVISKIGDKLDQEEKDLLYKFRYVLSENKKALIKLLLSIDWNQDTEVAEVPYLLSQFREKAPIDISDALKLLGRERAFQNPMVRQYAVEVLQNASNEELYTYLLQLVQALRYEPDTDGTITRNAKTDSIDTSNVSTNSGGNTTTTTIGNNVNTRTSMNDIRMRTNSWFGVGTIAPSSKGVGGGMVGGGGLTINTTLSGSTSLPNSPTYNTITLDSNTDGYTVSPLANFLITRACNSALIANSFYWFLKVETEDTVYSELFVSILEVFLIQLRETEDGNQLYTQLIAQDEYISQIMKCQQDAREVSGQKPVKEAEMRKLLQERQLYKLPTNVHYIPNPLNPSIRITGLLPNTATMFKSAVYPCVIEFDTLSKHHHHHHDGNISGNTDIPSFSPHSIIPLSTHSNNIVPPLSTPDSSRTSGIDGDGSKNSARLRKSGDISKRNLLSVIPGLSRLSSGSFSSSGGGGGAGNVISPRIDLTLPNESVTTTTTTTITVEEATSHSTTPTATATANASHDTSANTTTTTTSNNHPPLSPRSLLSPSATTTTTTMTTMVGGERVKIFFKSGDDLRQDQLIMQLIQLMDNLLKKVNLNLKFLTYRVLAVTQNDGIMEFVPNSMAFSAILAEYKTVHNFLRTFNPDKDGDYKISPLVMDTYIKSCAGSCVVTYILGIGDRHLDNIMMTKQGQLFHIDFGFIFGQDPKPLPPPFRITKEMVDGMGGEDSEYYTKFKGYCCQAYIWLRKSANLILNLLSLMGDASIEDISIKSDLNKVLNKVEERFRLDLSDEMAEQYFLSLINLSLKALAPQLLEMMHRVAVAAR